MALCTLLLLLPAAGSAQVVPGPAPAFSCADTTARRLGFLEGIYAAHATFRAGASAWDSTTAVVTVGRELGGCALREHFVGTRYGQPYEYVALWGANGGAAAPVQRAFVHSQHGILGLSAGGFVGDTLLVEDSAFVRGRWAYQRLALWRAGGPGAFRSEGRRSEDARRSWFVTQRTRYTPRGAEPAGRGRSP